MLTRDENQMLTKHLDKDHDTKIDWQEFSDKIHLRDYQKKSHRYLISQKTFTDRILSEWFTHRGELCEKIPKKL